MRPYEQESYAVDVTYPSAWSGVPTYLPTNLPTYQPTLHSVKGIRLLPEAGVLGTARVYIPILPFPSL